MDIRTGDWHTEREMTDMVDAGKPKTDFIRFEIGDSVQIKEHEFIVASVRDERLILRSHLKPPTKKEIRLTKDKDERKYPRALNVPSDGRKNDV